MAKLNTTYEKFGSNGMFKRNKYGADSSNLAGAYTPINGCIYPDGGSGTTDIICSNFGIGNTFFFSFNVEKKGLVFQAQYRMRKRYSPSNAAALLIDNSGSEVWTDWSEWTNEDDSTGEIPDEASDVGIYEREGAQGYRATWNKSFAHTYSELTDFDKYHYEFRVRLYNSAANECGQWTVCALPMCFAPAITGYSITKLSDGAWQCVINTNWQRSVYALMRTPCNKTGASLVQSAIGLAPSNGDGELRFQIPANFINARIDNNVYFRESKLYITEDGIQFGRWLSIEIPPYAGYQGVFYPKARTEPSLPKPTTTYNPYNQKFTWYVESSDKSTTVYDDVQVSITWIDNNNDKRTELYEMQYDASSKKWYTTVKNPPLDVNFTVTTVVVANGEWKAYVYDYEIKVPSDGLICFDNDQNKSVRLKYNQSVTVNDEIAGEVVDVVGRNYPVSRYGGTQAKTVKIEAQMLNSNLAGGDGWKADLSILTTQCDWVLRIPGGEKYRVFIESLDRETENPTNLKILGVSISCKVVGDE